MANADSSFRFLELPAEMRSQIYQELLCRFSFDAARTGYHDSKLARLMDQEKEYHVNEAILDIHTSILLVSRAVHQEAYEVMIKTNFFIRVHTFNLSLSEFLPRYKIPVVTMDRKRTAQFLGYVLNVAIHGEDTSPNLFGFEVENAASEFDFMILGRHWKCFCEALSYTYAMFKNAYFYLEFDATRLTRINEGTSYRGLFDKSFMQKTQRALLEPLRTSLRGAEAFCVYTVDDDDLADEVTDDVKISPWCDVPAWLGHLEDSSKLAGRTLAEGNVLEASGAFEHILEQLEPIQDNALHQSPGSYNQYKTIIHSCTLGIAQACLLQWQSPPSQTSEHWYARLSSIVREKISASSGAEQPKQRALYLLFCARFYRLGWVQSGQDKSVFRPMASKIANLLVRAEEEDAENKEIEEEGRRVLELDGLEGMTIRDVATLL